MRSFQARRPSTYEAQTYANPHFLVRYPHQIRFRTAVDTLLEAQPARLLDYGAGDGHLLVEAMERGLAADRVIAYEPVERFWRKLSNNVREHDLSDSIHLVTDQSELRDEAFDYIVCLGVLEHMPLPERQAFYDTCESSLAPDGRVLIDVPVEVGPTLLVKCAGRIFLKGRESEYTWGELVRAAAGIIVYDPGRFDPSDKRSWIQNHKGFDYRLLRSEVAHRFDIVAEKATPLSMLPASIGNQEVFFTAQRSGTSGS